MTKPRKLSAQEANRLAVQMQVLRIKLIEFSLRYTFHGQSVMWSATVDTATLEREKAKLTELYRVKRIFETVAYRDLPYMPGAGHGVKKIKEHYLKDEGTIGFVEVKEGSHGKSVVNHLWSKRTIKKRIIKKQQSSKRKLKQNGSKKTAGRKTSK